MGLFNKRLDRVAFDNRFNIGMSRRFQHLEAQWLEAPNPIEDAVTRFIRLADNRKKVHGVREYLEEMKTYK